MLIEKIGDAAMLELAAEECTELAQACLKMARDMRGDMPSFKSKEELYDHLCEETADVRICIEELSGKVVDLSDVSKWELLKKERNMERFSRKNNGQNHDTGMP